MQNDGLKKDEEEHIKLILSKLIASSCLVNKDQQCEQPDQHFSRTPSVCSADRSKNEIAPSELTFSLNQASHLAISSDHGADNVFSEPEAPAMFNGADVECALTLQPSCRQQQHRMKKKGLGSIRTKRDISELNRRDPSLISGFFLPHRDTNAPRFTIGTRFGPPSCWEFDRFGPCFLSNVNWQNNTTSKNRSQPTLNISNISSNRSITGQWGPHNPAASSPGPAAYIPHYRGLSTPTRIARPPSHE
jgi:hypothetical protein